MRRTSSTWRTKEILWRISLTLIIVIIFSACAKIGQKPQPKKFKPKAAPTQTQKVEVKQAPEGVKEIIRQEPTSLATASATPQRRAATRLLERGRQELANGEAAKAEATFQEAINVDHNNGIAYYYLSRAKFERGKFGAAGGVLDKAEELLGDSKEWSEAVSTLRQMINDKLKNPN